MGKTIRIGTRESQLAVWQASLVKKHIEQTGARAELIFIKSEGDIDLITPLYALGVQGVFTKTLDAALLNNRIDIAVHSMKDVPTHMAQGISTAAVLERASWKDILVPKTNIDFLSNNRPAIVATGSIRRKAQWLNRYPQHTITELRGNVNTRLNKLENNNWQAAIFAAAGLERIGLRPANAIDLDWMLPAPAQGAIMVVCRTNDDFCLETCQAFHHHATAICTGLERDFLQQLMGGCSTPISALATIENEELIFHGNIVSPNGANKASCRQTIPLTAINKDTGARLAKTLLNNGGETIIAQMNHDKN